MDTYGLWSLFPTLIVLIMAIITRRTPTILRLKNIGNNRSVARKAARVLFHTRRLTQTAAVDQINQ